MKRTYKAGDAEITVDLDLIAEKGADKRVGDFGINIDVTQEDESIDPVNISGRYLLLGKKRYVLFAHLESADTVRGSLQREIARMNTFRMVDDKLFNDTVKEVEKAVEADEKK